MALEIKGDLMAEIKEKILDKVNENIANFYATVVPLTPVGKSIRGRTKNNRLVKSGKARIRKGYTGGRLRKGWGLIPAQIDGDIVVGYVYNSTHYAAHVNYGHRTRQGQGKSKNYKAKVNGKKVVEGRYFIQKALAELGIKE